MRGCLPPQCTRWAETPRGARRRRAAPRGAAEQRRAASSPPPPPLVQIGPPAPPPPHESDPPLYTTILHKLDRSTYKHKRDDVLILSDEAIYVFSYPKIKLKFRLPLMNLQGITCSSLFDGFVSLQTPAEGKGDKGDMLFDTPHVYELVTFVMYQLKQVAKANPDMPAVAFAVQDTIEHTMKGGKIGTVSFATGEAAYLVVKVDGKKQLQVVAPVMETVSAFQKHTRASMRLRAPKEQ